MVKHGSKATVTWRKIKDDSGLDLIILTHAFPKVTVRCVPARPNLVQIRIYQATGRIYKNAYYTKVRPPLKS